jgi:hypothetical protein
MRLDHDHVRTIARAFDSDDNGERRFRINMKVLKRAMRRLSLWERGLVTTQLMQAAASAPARISARCSPCSHIARRMTGDNHPI